MRNTTVKIKQELFPEFVKLVRKQWEKGGEKYAGDDKKEFTDIICDTVGAEWILGTMMKYIGRIKNGDKRAPEDIIKVATYAFIYWIKMFTKEEQHKENPHTYTYKLPDVSMADLLTFRRELEKNLQQYVLPYCPEWWKGGNPWITVTMSPNQKETLN